VQVSVLELGVEDGLSWWSHRGGMGAVRMGS